VILSRWKHVCFIMAASFMLLRGVVLAEALATGPTTTFQETGATPAPQEESALDKRIRSERLTSENSFVLTPHRPNYILPLAYNWTLNKAAYGPEGDKLQPAEIKFQISFKADVAENIFGDNGDLYVAYTQISQWQAYNSDNSSPFRETNYEPEAFLAFTTDVPVLGLRNRVLSFGIAHQSNGREEPLSRSWNRIYAEFILDRGQFAMSLKPWYRIREPAETDNNPDIGRFMGPGELRLIYEWKKYVAALMVRNNFRLHDQKGAEQLEFSFPLVGRVKGYVQYFYGYGDTLIDYNARTNCLGIGVLLTDWL